MEKNTLVQVGQIWKVKGHGRSFEITRVTLDGCYYKDSFGIERFFGMLKNGYGGWSDVELVNGNQIEINQE